MKNFLFVSAENDAINGCKAGGMGDVIRDVPRQISAKGDTVHVITPSYSRLHLSQTFITTLHFDYRGVDIKLNYSRLPRRKYFLVYVIMLFIILKLNLVILLTFILMILNSLFSRCLYVFSIFGSSGSGY